MTSQYEFVEIEVRDHVAHLRLNRPAKLNAMNAVLTEELSQALGDLAADTGVRSVVLSGNGRAFSAGYDLTNDVDLSNDIPAMRAAVEYETAFALKFWSFPKPIIAAVHGYCLGGACHIAMACDITIAADTAQFGEPEIRMGGSATLIMPWLIPMKAAKELLLTGKRIDATRAEHLGMVNKVVPADSLIEDAHAMAQLIATIPARSVEYAKRTINGFYEQQGFRSSMQYGTEMNLLSLAQPSSDDEFMAMVGEQGLNAALKWRDAQYARFEERAR
ncbi:MAG: enoyl-CoA hydratase [Mycobacterium sp.]|jgi:enoyl-CoA hydratase/carnithine racemase|nr:enoyl-CoA hydratase [Mycobacterium sp.]